MPIEQSKHAIPPWASASPRAPARAQRGPRRITTFLAGALAAGALGFGQPWTWAHARLGAPGAMGPQQPQSRRQRKAQQQAERQAQQRQARQRQQAQRQDEHQHPPQFFRQLRDLPPDEQDRVLANDARFHQLPPERQQQVRDNLRRWNQLTPEQHETMRKDEAFFQSLSPENRARVRDEIGSPTWHQLPPDRRQAIVGAFRQMRGLSAAERQKFMESPDTQKSFSPAERDVLARLNSALP